jgi:hypothetical protein
MNKYMMSAFLDELGDIVKEADVMRDVGDPIDTSPSLKDRAMSLIGPNAINIGFGLMSDLQNKRNITGDLSLLGENVMHPSGFGPMIVPGAKSYFTGAPGTGGWRALNLLGTGATILEAKDALKKEDPTGNKRSRADRVSRVLGRVAGGVLGSGMGQTAGAVTGMVGESLGKGLGAGIDYLTGYDPNKEG